MASLSDLRAEIETLKTALASSNEEVARLKQILSDNLPNWEDCGHNGPSLPHTVDPELVSEPLAMSKLTKEDIERYRLIQRTELNRGVLRYSRQLILPELRVGGQEKLKVTCSIQSLSQTMIR